MSRTKAQLEADYLWRNKMLGPVRSFLNIAALSSGRMGVTAPGRESERVPATKPDITVAGGLTDTPLRPRRNTRSLTKAQLEAELANLRAISSYEIPAPRQKPVGIVVLQLLADLAVILVALGFLVRMWLGQ